MSIDKWMGAKRVSEEEGKLFIGHIQYALSFTICFH